MNEIKITLINNKSLAAPPCIIILSNIDLIILQYTLSSQYSHL